MLHVSSSPMTASAATDEAAATISDDSRISAAALLGTGPSHKEPSCSCQSNMDPQAAKNAPAQQESTLLDILQAVPQLLHACVTCYDGVKGLRLLCKAASVFALQAVRSYSLKLYTQPTPRQIRWGGFPEVTLLLKNTQLKHLLVEITVANVVVNGKKTVNNATALATAHDIIPHLTQLQDFMSAMGTALSSVASLKIQITFRTGKTARRNICFYRGDGQTQHSSSRNSSSSEGDSDGGYGSGGGSCSSTSCDSTSYRQYCHCQPACAPRDLSTEAETSLATLLAANCPNIQHLSVGLGFTETALSILGAQLPKLTSLEITDGAFPYRLISSTLQQLLPRITAFKMTHAMPYADRKACLSGIQHCHFLTRLEVEGKWLTHRQEWRLLPNQLKELSCASLPRTFPRKLRLPKLEALHLSDVYSIDAEVEVVASLLRAAPALLLLSKKNEVQSNSIFIGSCTLITLEDIQLLHTRLCAGLMLKGVGIHCSACLDDDLDREGRREKVKSLLRFTQVLKQLPRFSAFSACSLPDLEGEADTGCLQALAELFPKLRSLHLHRDWREVSISKDLVFECLTYLRVETMWPTELLELVARMPALTKLRHCITQMEYKRPHFNFLEALRARDTIPEVGSEFCHALRGMHKWHSCGLSGDVEYKRCHRSE